VFYYLHKKYGKYLTTYQLLLTMDLSCLNEYKKQNFHGRIEVQQPVLMKFVLFMSYLLDPRSLRDNRLCYCIIVLLGARLRLCLVYLVT
jgi:hypothetical protein